jgi:hypothetical protein
LSCTEPLEIPGLTALEPVATATTDVLTSTAMTIATKRPRRAPRRPGSSRIDLKNENRLAMTPPVT